MATWLSCSSIGVDVGVGVGVGIGVGIGGGGSGIGGSGRVGGNGRVGGSSDWRTGWGRTLRLALTDRCLGLRGSRLQRHPPAHA